MEPPQETPPSAAGNERLNIPDLMHNRNAVTRFSSDYLYDDLKTEGPVHCKWSFSPEIAGFSVFGHVAATLTRECVRCLEPYHVPVQVEIEERYVFDRFVARSEKEKELQSEDFYEVIKEDGELDLKDLAHQWLVLESENHSLCGRAECHFN
jgi:uncharacterized metal-binding protein YceD (DUF177 family)